MPLVSYLIFLFIYWGRGTKMVENHLYSESSILVPSIAKYKYKTRFYFINLSVAGSRDPWRLQSGSLQQPPVDSKSWSHPGHFTAPQPFPVLRVESNQSIQSIFSPFSEWVLQLSMYKISAGEVSGQHHRIFALYFPFVVWVLCR